MYEFNVEGMTCSSCVNSIRNAVKSLDANAEVNVDLKSQKVKVHSEKKKSEIASIIEEAGYSVLDS
ncbi:heavy metal-associated domain-containing protein [Bacteriovorax sp. PP10]|uniref:Heavy metal-associated domain-containing protein n=1 Tax=Bacteriovorax antarcticus TaxID=3088717 RepID=A0ABU5VZI5_9BACT|nr:heavy metal-associated domain-containing protein [Bacteriovorax sp. PP10]MEA9358488.1 heavy metal-associated domain-containing protein [Bacteriovorax sp. PP10]